MSSRNKGTDDCLVILTSITGISALLVLTVKGMILFLLGFPGPKAAPLSKDLQLLSHLKATQRVVQGVSG